MISADKTALDVQRKNVIEKISLEPWYAYYIPLLMVPIVIRKWGRKEIGHKELIVSELLTSYKDKAIAILGEPGSGKTVTLKMVAIEQAQKEEKTPIYVDLGKYGDRSLQDLIYDVPIEVDMIDNGLKQGDFVILLDALDKVPRKYSRKAIGDIERFMGNRGYPLNRYLITCRTSEWPSLEFKTFEIRPLTQRDTIDYLKKRFGSKHATDLYHQMGEQLCELCANPLYLTMFVEIYNQNKTIPRNKSSLYKQFIENLLYGWERDEINPLAKLEVLSQLSFEMNTKEIHVIDRQEAEKKVAAKLTDLKKKSLATVESTTLEIINELVEDGLLSEVENQLEFRHDSFQEFFAACFLKEEQVPIKKYINNREWDETLIFLSGLLEDSTNLINTIIEKKRLILGAKCIVAARKLTSETVYDFIELLISELSSVEPWDAYDALNELGQIAESHLKKHVDDSDPKIRRRAIYALGKLRAKEAVGCLTSHLEDNDNHVRYHCVRALGEITDKQTIQSLMKCLDDPNPIVVGHCICALESFSYQDMRPYVSAKTLQKMKIQLVDKLISLLEDKDSKEEKRAHAATVLGGLKIPQAIDALNRCLLEEKNDYIRSRAAIAVVELGDNRSISPLISFLKQGDRVWLYNFVWTLGNIGSEKTVSFLEKLKKCKDADIRQFAENTVDFIRTKMHLQFAD